MKTADGSIERSDGKIIFFSFDRFMSDIVRGNCCFICGVNPSFAAFNDEHVLPDWLLRKYGLHDKTVTLPNGRKLRYGGFTIPCCARCNALMGTIRETHQCHVCEGIQCVEPGTQRKRAVAPFLLMCLIFVKTHLKDTALNFHLDLREGEQTIGELHDWGQLHHIHCMARSFYTGCELDSETMGSLLVIPAKVRSHFESFDYVDLSFAKTMLLRVDETAIIAVLDDSQAALSIYFDELDKIRGPLSPLQAREVAAHFASINIHLAERTVFLSELDVSSEECRIVARRPKQLLLSEWDSEILGQIMHRICEGMLVGFSDKQEIVQQIKTGTRTFLVDSNGDFVANSMELDESGSQQVP